MKTKTLSFRRTVNNSELSLKDVGREVTLSGWVHRRRDHGGLIFIDLRDRFGLSQVVFDPTKEKRAHEIAESLRSEDVITIEGKVSARTEGMANPNLKTGEIEVYVEHIEVLSKAKTPPFSIADEHIQVNEELRLKYRYLDLRRPGIPEKLVERHKAMMRIREALDKENFIEITTPLLGKSTPEGSRDYLVPSRIHPGTFYALPQSPQIFKQILMVAGMDRYFQIAPCLRDEDLRADRQPEFTQVDMEMSFCTVEDLFPIIENLCHEIFKDFSSQEIPKTFRQETFEWCLENYGTDKPDLRFGMPLKRIDDIAKNSSFSVFLNVLESGGSIKGICVKGGADISRKGIDEYTAYVGQLGVKGLAWMKYQEEGLSSSIVKFFPENEQKALIERFEMEKGDLLFMVADEPKRVNQSLDHLRRKLAKDRNLIDPDALSFLWVTEFPLFKWDDEENCLTTEHHPFTSPHYDDLDLIESDPLQVRSLSYDLVINGYEVASGSQRIHNGDLQAQIFKTLKISEEEVKERFGFFIEALSYGTPPHIGAALGFDRLIMILTRTENIRDVVAFPKTQKATDLMSDSPSAVPSELLRELSLEIDV